ncbi:hypothetical protein [Nocardia xishanensis]|uniref:hypothetical protein n=1 Tax=Nocardia xishanensis TaxID=238964 RepID=UPI00082E38B3|nr:hypothetical protein [Nocardia xishanensis]
MRVGFSLHTGTATPRAGGLRAAIDSVVADPAADQSKRRDWQIREKRPLAHYPATSCTNDTSTCLPELGRDPGYQRLGGIEPMS